MPRKQTHTGAPVSFHDAPSGKSQKYQDIIARAKAKRVPDRPGDLENTPHFENTQRSWESRQPEQTQISSSTAAGLQAVAEATANAAPPPPAEEVLDAMPAPQTEAKAEPAEELDEQEQIKRAVSKRITQPIDIGEYLINGEVTQLVPIIPGKLEVTFRSVTDMEEAFVDAQLSKNRDATARVFLRHSNEWALSFHIVSVNGHKWPPTMVNGEINEAALEKSKAHVRKLSSPVFQLITQNLVWFLERVTKGLTLEVLGNG